MSDHEHTPGWQWCAMCRFWAPRCTDCFTAHIRAHHQRRRYRRKVES